MVLTIKLVPVVPEFNLVCFSCRLKTGTLIIGQIGLLIYLIHTVEAFSKLCFYEEDEIRGRQRIITRLLTGIIEILLHVLLIYGAWKEKPVLMLPFVILNYIMIIVLVIAIVVLIIIFLYMNMIGWAILALFLGTLLTAVLSYLWAGVYSYYRQLEETNLQMTETFNQQQPRTEETTLYSDNMQKSYHDMQYVQPQAV